MTGWTLLAVGLAGGLGGTTRFALDGLVNARRRRSFPVGTAIINLTGSFTLGLLAGLVASHALPHDLQAIAGTGFVGGFTTFSTASYETVRLAQNRRTWSAALNGLGILAGALAAAGGGLLLGQSS